MTAHKQNRMDTRAQSDALRVFASIGVVILHLQGSQFYIGDPLSVPSLTAYADANGVLKTLLEVVRGVAAMVGIFFISSGYGLALSHRNTSYLAYLKKRMGKIYLYAALCGLACSVIYYADVGRLSLDFIYCILPVFGLYETPRDINTIQYWFLSCLCAYYLIFPLLNRASDTLLTLLCLIIYIFGLLVMSGSVSIFTSFYHSTIFRLPEFILGILIARNRSLESFFFARSLRSLGLGCLTFVLGYLGAYSHMTYVLSLLFMSIGSFMVLCQMSNYWFHSARSRSVMAFLASGTFTLYLMHMATIRYLYGYAETFYRNVTDNIFLIFGADTLTLLVLSGILLVVGRDIERRYRNIIKL